MRNLTRLAACLAMLVPLFIHAADDDWKSKHTPKGNSWKKTTQHFKFNSGAEPESLDPHKVTTVDGSRLVEALFEGLVSADPETLKPRPACAKSWTISKDQKTYTFNLRPRLKWSNGRALTATDFVESYERALNPNTEASYVELYGYITGAMEFHKNTKLGFNTVGIKAPSADTVVFTLNSPCPFFLELLTLAVFSPVPIETIKEHGGSWVEGGKLVSNGAFVLESWEHRSKLILKKNSAYWDKDFVKLQKITATCYDDMNTAYKLFQEGELHWLPGIPQNRIEEIKRNPDFYSYPYFGTYFYRFNVKAKPFDNPIVRQAFSHATNRQEITTMLKGGQRPVASYCPSVGSYKAAPGLQYDVRRARALLAKAGYSGGKGFPPIEIVYNTNEGHKQIAEAIAQQWKNNLGITVSTRNMEWKVFLADMKELKYTIARSSWIGDYSDPATFFECFQSTSGNNRTGYTSAKYDRLLSAAQDEADQAKRTAHFQAMEKLLVETDCPIMPIYRYVDQGMLSESVLGWYSNIRSVHPLKYIWLED